MTCENDIQRETTACLDRATIATVPLAGSVGTGRLTMAQELIAAIIKRHIYAGQVLSTPGTGLPPSGQRPFPIAKVDDARIVFRFPSGDISIRFREIEYAIAETRKAGGRVRLGGNKGWADPGTLQRFLQCAKGHQQQTVSYVAPVLVECGIAEYTMEGRAKGIRLVGCSRR